MDEKGAHLASKLQPLDQPLHRIWFQSTFRPVNQWNNFVHTSEEQIASVRLWIPLNTKIVTVTSLNSGFNRVQV